MTDTERLDFLERQQDAPMVLGYDIPSWSRSGSGPWRKGRGHSAHWQASGERLRDAIDQMIEGAARVNWSPPREPINEVR